MNTSTTMQDIPPEQSLIEYPSKFPIKVMGLNVDGFVHAITSIAERFDPTFDATTVERFHGHFQTLLGHLAAAPETPISALSLLTLEERLELSLWHAESAEIGGLTENFEAETLHGLFAAQVQIGLR